jgi:acid stress-induced BolA-like protein IbaG/YrbA
VHIGDNPPIMANPTPAQLHAYIAAGLGCDHLDVQGDGQHFYATIVSPEFEGLSRVHRHQRVYAALGERMRAEIHALSMKTLTPAEWAAQGPAAALQAPAEHRH